MVGRGNGQSAHKPYPRSMTYLVPIDMAQWTRQSDFSLENLNQEIRRIGHLTMKAKAKTSCQTKTLEGLWNSKELNKK